MITYAIDFGTSNTILGAAENGKLLGFAPLDPHAADPAIIRTLIYFPNARQAYYGVQAIEEFVANDHAGRLVRSIKKQLPSRFFTGTTIDNRPMRLEDLIGSFLGDIRRKANEHFKQDVKRVVLGRPARFSMDDEDDALAQKRLEQSARIAGFEEITFMPEPIAAAVGYEYTPGSGEQIVLAADYGGGTSDFTVYRLGSKEFTQDDVIAIGGVPQAGDALDAAMMRKRISKHFGAQVEYHVPFSTGTVTMPTTIMEKICHPAEISLLRKQDTLEFLKNVKEWSVAEADKKKVQNLFTLLEDQLGFPVFEQIESTKRALSSTDIAPFEYHYPTIDISEKIKRKDFEAYSEAVFEKILGSLDETIQRAAIPASKISRVLCTGGTGKVPFIRQALIDRFGQDKLHDLDPFRGVASGLMKRASQL